MSVQKTFQVQISCPLITKKRKKVEKLPFKLSEKIAKVPNIFSAMARFL
jgi:hypothetical protein